MFIRSKPIPPRGYCGITRYNVTSTDCNSLFGLQQNMIDWANYTQGKFVA